MNSWINRYRLKHPRHFLTYKEERLLCNRINEFEKATGCELVFHFRKQLGSNPLEHAAQLFKKFNLEKTEHRAAILIVLSFEDRKYAVYTDINVSDQAASNLWVEVGNALSTGLKEGRRLEALLSGIEIAQNKLPKKSENESVQFSISNKPRLEEE